MFSPKNINDNSIVRLRPHQLRWENKHFILCCPETEFCVTISRKWKLFVELMDGKRTLSQVEQMLLSKKRYFDEEHVAGDVHHMLEKLLAWGFVERIDRERLEYTDGKEKNKAGCDLFPWLQPGHIGWIFAPFVQWVLKLVLVLGGIILIVEPQSRPRMEHFFWTDDPLLPLLSSFVLGWVLLALHESGHFLTAKYYGLRASFSLGVRMYFLVAQTHVYSIFLASKSQRRHIFLAGVFVDMVIMALSILVVATAGRGWIDCPGWVCAFLQQVILLQWLGIIWQCFFFMKTDVYYVLADAVGCMKLLPHTQSYLVRKAVVLGRELSFLPRKFRTWCRKQKLPHLHFATSVERELVPIYAFFVGVGVALLTVRFFVYFIPITWEVLNTGFLTLLVGVFSGDTWLSLQGMVILGFQLFQVVATMLLYRKKSVVGMR